MLTLLSFAGNFLPWIWDFFKDFLNLFIRERHTERGRDRQREKQAPCREPDAGLDPRTTGSRPEPKADAQPLSHSGASRKGNLNRILLALESFGASKENSSGG